MGWTEDTDTSEGGGSGCASGRPGLSAVIGFSALALAACTAPAAAAPEKPKPALASGLVALPCGSSETLKPHWSFYCSAGRHYVTTSARMRLMRVADRLSRRYPETSVRYLEASWALGKRPMPPHLSHGDGRQIDLALFYLDHDGNPLDRPPTRTGYGAYEPPLRKADRACTGSHTRLAAYGGADPPPDRTWRLDEVRTAALVRALSDDPKVRRIFIEPHLKHRLGFADDPKVRFAGCRAARHDDHIHVDFF
jgi:hypothetical protein